MFLFISYFLKTVAPQQPALGSFAGCPLDGTERGPEPDRALDTFPVTHLGRAPRCDVLAFSGLVLMEDGTEG